MEDLIMSANERRMIIGDRIITTNDWFARMFGQIPSGATGIVIDTTSSVLALVKWDHLSEPSHILYSILEKEV
jgi:hypothetical protein